MGPWQVLWIRVKVDLGVLAMKVYFTFPKSSRLESHHQMQFNFIPKIFTPADRAEEKRNWRRRKEREVKEKKGEKKSWDKQHLIYVFHMASHIFFIHELMEERSRYLPIKYYVQRNTLKPGFFSSCLKYFCCVNILIWASIILSNENIFVIFSFPSI